MPRAKCIEVRNAKTSDDNEGKLEMFCKVCGDKATGRNFDVLSCESCKAFFRRMAKRVSEFDCPLDSDCPINLRIRRCCIKCRLEKCFLAGMNVGKIESEEKLMERKRRAEAKKEAQQSLKPAQNLIPKEKPKEQKPRKKRSRKPKKPKKFEVPIISVQSPETVFISYAPGKQLDKKYSAPKSDDSTQHNPMNPRTFVPPPNPGTPSGYNSQYFHSYLTPLPPPEPQSYWIPNGHYSGSPSPNHTSPYFSGTPSPNGGMHASPNEMLMQMIQYEPHHYTPELPQMPELLPELPDFHGYSSGDRGGQEQITRNGGAGNGYTQLE